MTRLMANLILFAWPSLATRCREIEDDRTSWAMAKIFYPGADEGETLDAFHSRFFGRRSN